MVAAAVVLGEDVEHKEANGVSVYTDNAETVCLPTRPLEKRFSAELKGVDQRLTHFSVLWSRKSLERKHKFSQ